MTDANNSCTEEKHQTPSEENAWGVRGVKRDVWCRGRSREWREGGEVRKKHYTVSYSSSISSVEPTCLWLL